MQNRRRMSCLCGMCAALLVTMVFASTSHAAMGVLFHGMPRDTGVEINCSTDCLATKVIEPRLHATSPIAISSSIPIWLTQAQVSRIKIVPVPTAALMGIAMLVGLGLARRFRRK